VDKKPAQEDAILISGVENTQNTHTSPLSTRANDELLSPIGHTSKYDEIYGFSDLET
jgi:hypothetical protein